MHTVLARDMKRPTDEGIKNTHVCIGCSVASDTENVLWIVCSPGDLEHLSCLQLSVVLQNTLALCFVRYFLNLNSRETFFFFFK